MWMWWDKSVCEALKKPIGNAVTNNSKTGVAITNNGAVVAIRVRDNNNNPKIANPNRVAEAGTAIPIRDRTETEDLRNKEERNKKSEPCFGSLFLFGWFISPYSK